MHLLHIVGIWQLKAFKVLKKYPVVHIYADMSVKTSQVVAKSDYFASALKGTSVTVTGPTCHVLTWSRPKDQGVSCVA